jgi:hypothetical protein
MNNPADYLKIVVIAFVSVFIINRCLKAAGLSQFAATPNGGTAATSNS